MPCSSGHLLGRLMRYWGRDHRPGLVPVLIDAGYVTVTPSLELRVSRRIPEEFENGRDHSALEGSPVRMPLAPASPPSSEYLGWHADTVYRG